MNTRVPRGNGLLHKCATHLVVLALVSLGAVLCGCTSVLSVQPLYTYQDKVREPRLAGNWNGGEVTVEIAEEGFWYNVTLRGDANKPNELIKFKARLVELHGALWVDLFPVLGDESCSLCVEMHTFGKLSFGDDDLRLQLLDPRWVEGRAKELQLPTAKSDAAARNTALVLFADTDKLREFIAAASDESGVAFLDAGPEREFVLVRSRP
jgi:hypothetical protein